MKKLLASASFLALSSASVLAADFPMKAPMAAPVPVFSWTGCYIGGHVGAGTMHDSFTSDNEIRLRDSNSTAGTGTGGLAGGQIGCNYQDGNAVFGLEGEGYWSGLKASTGFSSSGGEGFILTQEAKNKSDYSIAARVGIAFDRTLVYGKAGWVWGNFDFVHAEAFPQFPIDNFSIGATGTMDGLLLGVGIEHALTRNWTVKLEYNFLDFGSKSFNFTACSPGSPCVFTGSATEHAQKQIFKVGFNYLFGWGGY